MNKRMLVAILLAVICTVPLVARQSAGMRYVMKMELQELKSEQPAASNPMAAMAVGQIKQMMFPEGAAEMEFLTDGQSVRTEMHSQMATLPKGAIVLYPAGQTEGYVLNTAEKTYYVMKAPPAMTMPGGMTLPKPEIAIKPSGTFDTIVGHKAEKVNITWRMAIPVPEGAEMPPGMPTELTMDIENWCAADVKIPAGAMRLMSGMAQSMPGLGLEDITKACPFALRSSMRMSIIPGYAIVSNVTSADAATPAAEMFKVPAGYKEVQAPSRPGGN